MTARTFDPAGPADPDAGLYGLGSTADEARVHVIPVPYEATTSYGGGTSKGPEAVLAASGQVDLYDFDNGRPYEAGIALLDVDPEIVALNAAASRDAREVIARIGETDPELDAMRARVNGAGSRLNEIVRERALASLRAGKLVGLLGGDHATPFGMVAAVAEMHPGVGVLHVDAHHDLREAYEGFTWSHASIMHNVVTRLSGVQRLVQVGIRDFSEDEAQMVAASERRIVCYYEQELRKSLFDGMSWSGIVRTIVAQLPEEVYVSFDIDGLDPTLCPGTGTPVPGGLSFEEAVHLLRALVHSGRRIVGFDLCEVSPGVGEWDANVGARVLYKLIGFMLRSRERG